LYLIIIVKIVIEMYECAVVLCGSCMCGARMTRWCVAVAGFSHGHRSVLTTLHLVVHTAWWSSQMMARRSLLPFLMSPSLTLKLLVKAQSWLVNVICTKDILRLHSLYALYLCLKDLQLIRLSHTPKVVRECC